MVLAVDRMVAGDAHRMSFNRPGSRCEAPSEAREALRPFGAEEGDGAASIATVCAEHSTASPSMDPDAEGEAARHHFLM